MTVLLSIKSNSSRLVGAPAQVLIDSSGEMLRCSALGRAMKVGDDSVTKDGIQISPDENGEKDIKPIIHPKDTPPGRKLESEGS